MKLTQKYNPVIKRGEKIRVQKTIMYYGRDESKMRGYSEWIKTKRVYKDSHGFYIQDVDKIYINVTEDNRLLSFLHNGYHLYGHYETTYH